MLEYKEKVLVDVNPPSIQNQTSVLEQEEGRLLAQWTFSPVSSLKVEDCGFGPEPVHPKDTDAKVKVKLTEVVFASTKRSLTFYCPAKMFYQQFSTA